MRIKKRTNISYLYSFAFHAFIVLAMIFVNFSVEQEYPEFVEVGFGTFGKFSSTGKTVKEEIKKEKKDVKKNEKDVNLPTAKNKDLENESIPNDIKEKKKAEEEKEKPNILDEDESTGMENNDSGLGNFGISFEWGGKGKRRIYSWVIPPYPEGVAKEIDVKLRFSILPDGTVGRIFPLIKADTRLENAAITSLRQWRFEPLPNGLKRIEQTVVITFPFRLQ